MSEPPRRQAAQILNAQRLTRLVLYGATMMVGTILMFRYGIEAQGQAYALTLAFTTFVLFQFFNVFNARAEYGSVVNANFFKNAKLWLALASVLALQVVAVHWPPAQAIFSTTALQLSDWLLAALVASSVLLLDEARKLLMRAWLWFAPK